MNTLKKVQVMIVHSQVSNIIWNNIMLTFRGFKVNIIFKEGITFGIS